MLQKFLNKFPMSIKITGCEFIANYSHGCWIDEHWKGPISLSSCTFSQNLESGLTLKAEKYPVQLLKSFEKPLEDDVALQRDF